MWNLFGFSFVCLHIVSATTGNFDAFAATCRKSLGMQSGALPDSAISASSSYDEPSVGPANARIRTERNGGAWCPKQQINRTVYEWIEIDLQELKVVTQVETQGRFGNGQGQEYAENYLLEYRRQATDSWIRFRDRRGNEYFTGNSNTYLAEMRDIVPPVIARWLRVVPYSSHPRTVCMRVELYGCPWRDGVTSYSMPQGERRGTEVELLDFTYEYNATDGGYLSGGLGQLTDGVEGHSNFRLDPDGWGHKGYEWVGWKNDTEQPLRPPIEILFAFDRVRNFSGVRIHSNNLFSKDIRVFRRVVLHFGLTGNAFQEHPVAYEHARDSLIEFARNVVVPIPHRIGRFVRMEFYFDARWMLISEIRFESEIVNGNVTNEPQHQVDISQLRNAAGLYGRDSTGSQASNEIVDRQQRSSTAAGPFDQTITIATVVLVVSLFVIISSLTLVCVVRRRSRKHRQQTIKSTSGCIAVKTTSGHSCSASASDYLHGNFNNTNKSLVVSLTGNNFSSAYGSTHVNDGFGDAAATAVTTSASGYRLPVTSEETFYGGSAMHKRQLPELPLVNAATTCQGGYLSDTNTSTYAVPDPSGFYNPFSAAHHHHQFQSIDQLSPPAGLSPQSFCSDDSNDEGDRPPLIPPLPRPMVLYRAAGDGAGGQVVDLQGSCGSSLYAASPGTAVDIDLQNVTELRRDSFKFIRKIGEGIFGEVHLCEINVCKIPRLLTPTTDGGRDSDRQSSFLVAVKVLNKNTNIRAKSDFLHEASLMAKLTDPNIVSLVGACTRDEPFAIAVEYMTLGDLNQFLRRHVPAETETVSIVSGGVTAAPLSHGCLIYLAMQIASGMKYLESLNVVHRDLAARNCLVGNEYLVKVSDFGMSRNLYARDYYRFEGRAMLPIRWMAWESVILGRFTTMTDVWSFGVTLWEILTFARRQPFETLTDDQVIENCGHYHRSDCDQICLPPPPACPKEIVDLMRECWNREECQRPTFREIRMFLERKNRGYRPDDAAITTTTNLTTVAMDTAAAHHDDDSIIGIIRV